MARSVAGGYAMASLLVLTVFLPLLGALALALSPKIDYRTARWVALGTVLATLALSLVLGASFKTAGAASYQFAFQNEDGHLGHLWVPLGIDQGIRFALGLDGISLVLFLLTTLLMVPSVFASWEPVRERAPLHYALMLALQTGLLGLFSSLDVVLFYIFFEFTLIPLFFLIGIFGGPDRRWASIYFFLYTLAGSLLTLIGVIALVMVYNHHSPRHILTFSIPELTQGLASLKWQPWQAESTISWTSPQALIFLLLFAGFAIKVPLFPFHTWLPLAHVEAPTAGSILLAGVLLKVGGYGFIRFNLGMTPHGAYYLFPFLAWVAVVGIIYGALTALAQSDVKRLVAYSSVSHMGFVALGTFSLTATGLDGAVIQMINHGLTTGALFACVGIAYERYHTREMGEVGGLWKRLPLLAFFFMIASLGSAAVPGLNGFVGEFPILVGMFSREPFFAVLGAIGMVLGAYYLLQMLQKLIFGPLREPGDHNTTSDGHHDHDHHATSHDSAENTVTHSSGGADPHVVPPVAWHEIAGLVPLMALIVLIGLYPKPIFDRISPPVRELVSRFYVPPDPNAESLSSSGEGASCPVVPGDDPESRLAGGEPDATPIITPGDGSARARNSASVELDTLQ